MIRHAELMLIISYACHVWFIASGRVPKMDKTLTKAAGL
jgi:hypothetical protein